MAVGSRSTLLLRDIAGDIIRDIECQKNDRDWKFTTTDGEVFEADWYFRWNQDETVDWTAVEGFLDEPKDIRVWFDVIKQKYSRASGKTHSWLECKIFSRAANSQQPNKETAPPAATWANLVRGQNHKQRSCSSSRRLRITQ